MSQHQVLHATWLSEKGSEKGSKSGGGRGNMPERSRSVNHQNSIDDGLLLKKEISTSLGGYPVWWGGKFIQKDGGSFAPSSYLNTKMMKEDTITAPGPAALGCGKNHRVLQQRLRGADTSFNPYEIGVQQRLTLPFSEDPSKGERTFKQYLDGM